MKKGVLLVLLMIFCAHVSAQERSCGAEEYMQEMLKDLDFKKQWAKDKLNLKKELARRSNADRNSFLMDEIVIPVAVHFPEGLEEDRLCLEALAQNQIDILNADFTATNSDANLWTNAVATGNYPGIIHGAANIKFCIATSNHPANTDDDLIEGGPAVSIGYDFGGGTSTDPLWGGYLNFLVKSLNGGTLGFSPVPGNIAAGQSVTMNTFAFGSGAGCPGFEPGAPYNLGRTTTHELGHFFDLRHVWGDGDCSVDDGVADTPLQDAANGGCPAPAQFPACDPGEFELSMNYMDYTDDACMYMFSQGQIDIVDAYVAGVLQPQFKPNTVPICVETPEYTMTDGLINTCNGIFYDSGGADGNYANNETFTYTICPENTDQIIQLDFISFSTQLGIDILSIYNAENADDPTTLLGNYSGTDAADSPGIVAATTTNTSGCLTIVFTSNNFGNEAGWQANISCQDRPAECQTILAQLDSAAPQPNDDGYIFVCPGEEITLSGSGTFSEPGGGDGATYQWETGDGTLIDGQTVTFSFDEPGVYVANLNIWDTNTTIFPEGCKNTNLINQIIKVSTTPDFSETSAASNRLCFGDSTTITPVVIPTPYINECTPPESEVTFLPDGSGVSYETSIIVDCFDSDQTINDVNELLEICLVLEHSYLGDLDIEIISPSGQTVVLQSQGGGSANLGEPWATAGVDNNSGNTTPGVGYQYCFVPDNTLPTLVGGIVSGGTFVSGDGPGTYNDSFVPEGTYSSVESLEGLVGSFLNGSWTIRITDNIGLDNGYIFSWTLNFDPALQPPNLSFTPEIVSGSWMDDSSITETNGDTITVAPPSEGDFCYTYTALDNFNCEYSYEICINVSPEILYDLPTDLFICDQVSPPYIFDLSENEITMLAGSPNPADYVVTFHNSLIDAENDVSEITNTTAYEGSDNEQIFIRFEYFESNCFKIESFNLNLIDLPQIFEAPDLVSCDDLANDGIEEFDLAQQTALILGGQSSVDYEVSYHEDFASAEAGTGDLTSPYLSTSDAQGIYVRVQSAGGGGCYIVSPDPLFSLIVTNKATAVAPENLSKCDSSGTGALEATFDLEQQTATILGALQDPSTFTVTYHSDPTDAESGDSPLVSPLTTTSRTIYVRVEEDGLPDCYETTEFELIVNPNPEVTDQSATACSASTVGLTLADDVDGPSVASYDLTSITPEAGLAADASNAVLGTNLASDAIASDVWTNTTATPLDVVYSFTPVSSDNCIGEAFTVTVTVNPEPEVADQSTTICSASTVGLTLADDVDGPSVASYDLTAITPSAGLSADASNAVLGTNLASDAIASDVWINTTATPLDVVYSFTPVSSDNCIGAAFTVTVTVNPEPEVTDQSTTICSASTVGLTLADDVDGPSVSSYDLTSITPEAGLAADASNAVLGTNLASDAIALDVWTNTTATPLDVVYSFTPVSSDNCIGAAFTVTVTVSSNPEVADQSTTACSASTVGLTLADDVDGPSVASYDLTSITPSAGLSADASNAVLGTNLASDAIASDVWTNTTATPLDVVYSFTPVSSDNCIGEAFTVTVTVNPEPEVADQSTTICSASTVGLTLADDVDGPSVASYDLTAITPSAGLSADASNAVLGTNLASDAIASDVWINTTATPLDVVYSFTPVSSDNCIGAAFTVTVTVNPEPEVTDQSTTICSASTVGLTLADDVDGPSVSSYDLTSITPEAGLAADASNAVLGTNLASDAIALDVWTNTTATPLDVVYSFTPVSSDNCIGAAFTVTVTVSSNPEVADQSTTACSASTVGLTLADDVDGPSVASYDLTSITPSAGLSADASNAVLGTNLASDAIASDVWTNTTATPLDVVYSFTPVSSDNCIGEAFTVTVTVNPEPEVADQSTTICSASTVGLTLADDVDGPSVASYDLTAITPSAGLSADASNAVLGTNLASDAIASDVWINTTATPLDVVYSFTPVSSDNCIGAAFTVTVTVNPEPEVTDQSTTICSASTVGLTLADDVDGPSVSSYDLTSITPEAGLAADASNAVLGTNLASDAIALDVWTNTTATPLDVVYSFTPVSSDNCIGAAFTVTVTVSSNPEVADQSTTACSASTVGLTLADDVDGPSVASYDLTSITPEAGLSADASNAVLGTNLASDAIASDVWTNTTATPLDVVYSFTPVSSDNCIGAAFTVTVTVNPLPVPAPAFIDSKCDDDTDGLQTFDMSGVAAQVIGSQTDMVVSYHLTLTDAENNTAALGDNITTTTPNLQTIHIRLENTLTNCYATSTIDLVVDPLPEIDLEGNYVICSDATGGGLDYVVVDPGLSPATYNFIWRDELGGVLSTDSTYTVDQGGIYSLEVSFASTAAGCSAPLEIFTVSESGAPAVTVDVVTEAFADTHVVVATAVGTGIYEFSLDQGPWLDSGTFIGVDPGDHTVYVRDVNGCGVTATMIYIVDYPKYFTPNGDGYHDTWNIDALSSQLGSKIYIFDRYGKLLKQITPAGEGWDGTYNGQQMPTTDYWFMLEYNDLNTGVPKQLRAHFSLKR